MKGLNYIWKPTREEWQKARKTFLEANFLQSYEWGVFNESMGKKVLRLLVTSNGKVVALVSMVVEEAKRGTYLAIAGGPLLDWKNDSLVMAVMTEIRQKAIDAGCTFIRFRPQVVFQDVHTDVLKKLGAIQSPMHLTADLTLQLDLVKTEEQLLKEMRKNTRSAIKKADRVGIKTVVSTDISEITRFYEEEEKLAKKHGFIPFSRTFLENQFKAFLTKEAVALVHSYSADSKLLASAFVIFDTEEAVYHYGVSTEENSKLPGSYACQWRAILEAKARGCSRYNFWGIAPKEEKNHRFSGVSLFKRGFGGFEVPYLPAHDIPLSWRYWGTYFFEYLRKKYRRL